jgi:hypothetical protein
MNCFPFARFALMEGGVGATIPPMSTREQLHKDVDAVPDDQLDHAQVVVLDANGDQLEPSGTIEYEKIPTFEESIAILANFEFLPREDAWH